MQPDFPLPIETNPDLKHVLFLEDQINEFNFKTTGITDGELLAIFLRGTQNEIVAGIYGWTWGGTCEIRYLWVQAEQRGQGIGSQLLAQAEQEAVRRGCRQIVLDTHSFQAPGFYLKMGYQIIASHENYPRGYAAYYLRKELGK
jgi:ribosomal protein S18 acetylase RimI-like enzyme